MRLKMCISTIMCISKENNRALATLNNELSETRNHRGKTPSYLLSPLPILSKQEILGNLI